jgi:hypothetical protein
LNDFVGLQGSELIDELGMILDVSKEGTSKPGLKTLPISFLACVVQYHPTNLSESSQGLQVA